MSSVKISASRAQQWFSQNVLQIVSRISSSFLEHALSTPSNCYSSYNEDNLSHEDKVPFFWQSSRLREEILIINVSYLLHVYSKYSSEIEQYLSIFHHCWFQHRLNYSPQARIQSEEVLQQIFFSQHIWDNHVTTRNCWKLERYFLPGFLVKLMQWSSLCMVKYFLIGLCLLHNNMEIIYGVLTVTKSKEDDALPLVICMLISNNYINANLL